MVEQVCFEIRTSKILILIMLLNIFEQLKIKELKSSERRKSQLV